MTNDSTKNFSKEYLDKIIKEDRKAYYKNWRSKIKIRLKNKMQDTGRKEQKEN